MSVIPHCLSFFPFTFTMFCHSSLSVIPHYLSFPIICHSHCVSFSMCVCYSHCLLFPIICHCHSVIHIVCHSHYLLFLTICHSHCLLFPLSIIPPLSLIAILSFTIVCHQEVPRVFFSDKILNYVTVMLYTLIECKAAYHYYLEFLIVFCQSFLMEKVLTVVRQPSLFCLL